MLFNSLEFLFFLPTVFLLYWFVFQKNLKSQNATLLISSYIFYCWWDWRFLFLILLSSGINYLAGILLADKSRKHKKAILALSCAINIGILGFFKYFGFFVDDLISACAAVGIHLHARTLNLILPLGISFYTLKALSYTIDVYKNKLEPTKDIIAFFCFVGYFPQLLAGPIDRATDLLPQFLVKRTFACDTAADGLRQILWGFFKKIVVADSCAVYVNQIFAGYETLPASTLAVGAVYFAFQLYGDFSGYSDIAIGTSRLFGFSSKPNFSTPYFSRDIAEFWRRWHISLTAWFREYLYIPLGGNRGTKAQVVKNTFIVFLICGIWHGANWTFVAWGFINALFFLPLLLLRKNQKHTDSVASGKILPNVQELLEMLITFALVVLGWIFFRADSVGQAVAYIGRLFSSTLLSWPVDSGAKFMLPVIAVMVIIEWLQRDKTHGLESLQLPVLLRWFVYDCIIVSILWFVGREQPFIYFKF